MTEPVDPTRDLRRLATLATSGDLDDTFGEALVALGAIVPYDLAVLFALEGDELVVRAARGRLDGPEVRRHRLPLDRHPTLVRAMRTRRPVALLDHDHDTEGDPYDGVLDLPHGHSCMVVPLFAADRTLGVITLDRAVCEPYPSRLVDIAGVYGQIVSMAMALTAQAALLERYREQLSEHSRLLEVELGRDDPGARLTASRSPAMRRLVEQARQVARADVPVLIRGETGAGKEVVAEALHAWSQRAEGVLVKLNCAAIPATLIESELFGHVRGAFSGASTSRPGRFLTADGGTLLLDEIGDLPLEAQAKLLRVLQEGAFEPVGSDRTVRVDVRVLAATHRDLDRAVQDGRFREDLYYRLAVFPLHVPPLRDRLEDVPALAASILARIRARTGRGPWTLSEDSVRVLAEGAWPGNVRQLANALERATILCPTGSLEPSHFEPGHFELGHSDRGHSDRGHSDRGHFDRGHSDRGHFDRGHSVAGAGVGQTPASESDDALSRTLDQVQADHIRAVLAHTDGKIYGEAGAARILGMNPSTLQSRMKKLGVSRR